MERLLDLFESAVVFVWFAAMAAVGIYMAAMAGIGTLGIIGQWPAPIWATVLSTTTVILIGVAFTWLDKRFDAKWIVPRWILTVAFVMLVRYGIARFSKESAYSITHGLVLGIGLASWLAYRQLRRDRAAAVGAEPRPPLTRDAE